MCMIFGLSALQDTETNEYLKAFYSHSTEHPHGWGQAVLRQDSALIEKESLEASKSNYLRERLSVPVRARLLLAHIRYATVGHVAYCNCHPFSGTDASGRRWTLTHNGTIFDCPALSKYFSEQTGETDSERILLCLLDRINAAQREKPLSFDARFALLDALISEMAAGNKLNLMLSDGRDLYVHTNCRDTLYCLEKENAALFSTVPLTNEDWRPAPFTTLLAYRDGKRVKTGTDHGCEYTEDPEHLKFLYQIFSEL